MAFETDNEIAVAISDTSEETQSLNSQDIINTFTEKGISLKDLFEAIETIKKVYGDDISNDELNRQLLLTLQNVGPEGFKEQKKISGSAFAIKSLSSILDSDLKPPKMIIKDLLTPGLTVFAASPKSGKSWMCLEMAVNLVQGKEMFLRKVEKGNVLYLALEDSEYRLKSRTEKILQSHQSGKDIQGLYVTTKAKTLKDGLLEDLKQYIDSLKIKVIIIDTLQKIKSVHSKSQEYGYEYAALGQLQEFALKNNVAIIIVHHTSKQGEYKKENIFETIHGSTAISGASDNMWVLDRKRNGDATLHVTGRDIEMQELSIRWDADFCTWVYMGDAAEQEIEKKRAKFKTHPITIAIKSMLETSGGEFKVTSKQLVELAKVNMASKTASIWIKENLDFFDDENIEVDLLKSKATTTVNGVTGRYITFKKI